MGQCLIAGVRVFDDTELVRCSPLDRPQGALAIREQPRQTGRPRRNKEENYGDGTLYPKIFEANRDVLKDPNVIRVGQKLRIP